MFKDANYKIYCFVVSKFSDELRSSLIQPVLDKKKAYFI